MVIVVPDEWSARGNGEQIYKGHLKSSHRIREKNSHYSTTEDIGDTYNDILFEIRNNLNWGVFIKQTKDNFSGYLKKIKCHTQPFLQFFNTRRVYCQSCQRLAEHNYQIASTPNNVTVNSRFNDCYVEKITSKLNTMVCKSHTSFSCDRCKEHYILKRKEVKSKCPMCSAFHKNKKCYANDMRSNKYCSANAVDKPYNPKDCRCQIGEKDEAMWNMQFKRWWGWNVGRKRNRCCSPRKDCWCSSHPLPVLYRMEPWDAYDIYEERKRPKTQYVEPSYCLPSHKIRRGSVSCFSCCFGYPRRIHSSPYQPCIFCSDAQVGRREKQNADKHMYQSWVKDSASNSSNGLYDKDKRNYRPPKSSIEYLSCRIESVTHNLNENYECCCCCPCRTEYKIACCQTNTDQKQISQAAQTQRQCCKCCRKKCNKCKSHCAQSTKTMVPNKKVAAVEQMSESSINLIESIPVTCGKNRTQNTSAKTIVSTNNCKNANTNTMVNEPANSRDIQKSLNENVVTEMEDNPRNSRNSPPKNLNNDYCTSKNKNAINKKSASLKLAQSKSENCVRTSICNCKKDSESIYFSQIKTSPLFLDPIFNSPLTGRKYSILSKSKKGLNKIPQHKPLNTFKEMYQPFIDLEMHPNKMFKLQKPNLNQRSVEEFFDLQSRDNYIVPIQSVHMSTNDLSLINLPEFLRTNSLLSKCELCDLDNIIKNIKQNTNNVNECRKSCIQEEISNCDESNDTSLIEASKIVCDIMKKPYKAKTNIEAAKVVTNGSKENKFGFTPSTSINASPIIPPPPGFETPILKTINTNECCQNNVETIENSENANDSEEYINRKKCQISETFLNGINSNSLTNLLNNMDDINCSKKYMHHKINDVITSTNLVELNSTGTSTVDLSSNITLFNEFDLPSLEISDDLKPLSKINKSHRSFGDLFRRNRKKVDKALRESIEIKCCMATKKQ